jgi:peptidoglycan/LPS O-acetylase OafA/YrhL
VRLRPLDGLRGFAALAVVICHAMITSQVLFAALFVSPDVHRFSLDWWLTRPPLNLLWSGQQPVIIFFVLSGLVVALPFTREVVAGPHAWLGYYPKRLIRLYLPTWAAVGVAALLAYAITRHSVVGQSRWLAGHDNPSWHGISRDAGLLQGTDELNGPLWSLQWEMWFSLMLPLYVAFARVARRASPVKVLIMLDLVAVGVRTGHTWLIYLPVFGIGSAIAGDLDRVGVVAEWMRGRRLVPILLLACAVALLEAKSLLLLHGPVAIVDAASTVAVSAGGGLIVLLALISPPMRSACDSQAAQWLGKQSFSLYLIHEPIVVSVALLFGANTSNFAIAAVAVPASLLAAWVFQLSIEGPAHDLSRRVGQMVTEWGRKRAAEAEQFT